MDQSMILPNLPRLNGANDTYQNQDNQYSNRNSQLAQSQYQRNYSNQQLGNNSARPQYQQSNAPNYNQNNFQNHNFNQNYQNQPPQKQTFFQPVQKPLDIIEIFDFIPQQSQSYILAFKKKSKVGCVIFQRSQKLECSQQADKNQDAMNQSMAFDDSEPSQDPQIKNKFKDIKVSGVSTDFQNHQHSGKVMGDIPIQYNKYLRNIYYFQVRVDDNYDDLSGQIQSQGAAGRGQVKLSVGFCRDNFDLNKNSILEQSKNKEYWILDLFDGEAYSSSIVQNGQRYIKYLQPQDFIRVGDVLGVQIDVENGCIQYFKNGRALGIVFNSQSLTRGKLYPLLMLYKCKITVFQENGVQQAPPIQLQNMGQINPQNNYQQNVQNNYQQNNQNNYQQNFVNNRQNFNPQNQNVRNFKQSKYFYQQNIPNQQNYPENQQQKVPQNSNQIRQNQIQEPQQIDNQVNQRDLNLQKDEILKKLSYSQIQQQMSKQEQPQIPQQVQAPPQIAIKNEPLPPPIQRSMSQQNINQPNLLDQKSYKPKIINQNEIECRQGHIMLWTNKNQNSGIFASKKTIRCSLCSSEIILAFFFHFCGQCRHNYCHNCGDNAKNLQEQRLKLQSLNVNTNFANMQNEKQRNEPAFQQQAPSQKNFQQDFVKQQEIQRPVQNQNNILQNQGPIEQQYASENKRNFEDQKQQQNQVIKNQEQEIIEEEILKLQVTIDYHQRMLNEALLQISKLKQKLQK